MFQSFIIYERKPHKFQSRSSTIVMSAAVLCRRVWFRNEIDKGLGSEKCTVVTVAPRSFVKAF